MVKSNEPSKLESSMSFMTFYWNYVKDTLLDKFKELDKVLLCSAQTLSTPREYTKLSIVLALLISNNPYKSSYSGSTKSIAVTLGETKDLSRNFPRGICNIFWCILLFYILSILVIGLTYDITFPDWPASQVEPACSQLWSSVVGSIIKCSGHNQRHLGRQPS